LLEFLSLFRVIERKGVQISRAPDLKLCALFRAGGRWCDLFDACRYFTEDRELDKEIELKKS
jgi:hypothetical protein